LTGACSSITRNGLLAARHRLAWWESLTRQTMLHA
jgi:hypothetical protein